jgi:drug/metabolite transporter (DMT)-like permease
MWVPLAIMTAVAFAATGSYAKALSRRNHVYVITWSMMALSLPWTALVLLAQGLPPVGSGFLKAAAVSLVLNLAAVTLQVKALSLSPLSLTMPFLAFTPLFMILTSSIVLGEVPDSKGLLGIVLIASGAYAINLEKLRGGALGPLRAVASEKGSRLMLIVALIWSVTAVYDKVAVLESSPAFYTTCFSAVFGLLYAPALLLGLRRTPPPRGSVPRLILLGALSAVMIISQMSAIELTAASYVIAVKRAGMVIAVLLGYVFFKERHVATRLLGASLMMAGVAVLSA